MLPLNIQQVHVGNTSVNDKPSYIKRSRINKCNIKVGRNEEYAESVIQQRSRW